MKKEFAFNIFFLLLINLLIKPFYIFGIESKVQQVAGDAAFGLYFSLFGLVFLHQFINDPGIQNYNVIFVAQNRDKIYHHFPRLLGIKVLLLLLMLGSVLASSMVLGYSGDVVTLLIGIVMVLFLSGLFVLLRSLLSSLGYYKADTWLSGIDRLLLVMVLGGLLYTKTVFNIYHFVAIQMAVYLLCVVTLLYLLHVKKLALIPVFDWHYSKQFLQSCLPYTLIIFLTAIIMRGDGVIIERMLKDGNVQAGIYAKGYRFLDAANMFGYLFGALLLPMYANKIDHKQEINDLFRLAYKMLLFLSLFVCLVFYCYRQDIFTLFYGSASSGTIKQLVPLLFAILPVAMTNVFGPLIVAAHKVSVYNKLYMGAVVFYLAANLIFVPTYGIYASAMIALITWTMVLIGMVIIASFYRLIVLDKKLLLNTFKIIIVLLVFFFLANKVHVHWVIKSAFIGSASLILLSLGNVIPLKDLYKKG